MVFYLRTITRSTSPPYFSTYNLSSFNVPLIVVLSSPKETVSSSIVHFISDDKTKGGHILELRFDKATVEYDITPGFEMILTNNSDFQKMELSKDVSAAIKKVETNE